MKMSRSMVVAAFAVFALLAGAASAAQLPRAKGLVLPGDVSTELADVAIKAAIAEADSQGTLMNIAIVDAGGNLKAFCRMDGAFLGSIDISQKKARTARFLNMPTTTLRDAAQPEQELYGIEVLSGGMAIFGGGELLKDADGTIIGAIGVSGSSVANDVGVAKAGARAVLEAAKK